MTARNRGTLWFVTDVTTGSVVTPNKRFWKRNHNQVTNPQVEVHSDIWTKAKYRSLFRKGARDYEYEEESSFACFLSVKYRQWRAFDVRQSHRYDLLISNVLIFRGSPWINFLLLGELSKARQ